MKADPQGSGGIRTLLFTRYPEAGVTKTRLIPELGAEGAANLQREMTEHMLSILRQGRILLPLKIEVCYTGAEEEALQPWLGTDLRYAAQKGDHLGQRLNNAFASAFADGCAAAWALGGDIPGITTEILVDAAAGLAEKDLVLGPAEDGGYYLLGLKAPTPQLFEGIDWGTDRVFEQTLNSAQALGLSHHLLPPLRDIDRPEDLPTWQALQSDPTS